MIMFSPCRHRWWLLGLSALCGLLSPVRAQYRYANADKSFTFQIPKRWKVEEKDNKLLITTPDDTHYTLQRDNITPMPSGSPVTDAGVKETAAKLVAPILPNAAFVSAQSVPMDHGLGATFRFQEKGKSDDTARKAEVWIGVIGKHCVTLLPEKAGQSGQTIGLSVIFESLTFTDALPPAPRPRPQDTGSIMTAGAGGVSFQQVRPILQARCQGCHHGATASGGFSVTSFAEVMKGGDSGALVVAGKPDQSHLLDYLTGTRKLMPLGGPRLSDSDIDLFRRWIAGGATQFGAGGGVAGSPGAPGTPGTTPKTSSDPDNGVKTPARNRAARIGKEAALPALLEGYSGHLSTGDGGFTLRLMRDGTATGEWTFSPQVTTRFTGTYVGKDGNYTVTLNQASGTNPYRAKTLTLDMRSRGAMEQGQFQMDTSAAHYSIADLELTELGVPLKGNNGGGGGNAQNGGRRPGGKGRRMP